MSPLAEYVAQTGVTLVGIALLAWLVVYTGRRAGLARDEQHLRLRGMLRLDARRSVYLVEVAGRVLVVAAGEGGISKLAELRRDELSESEARPPRSFSEVFDRIRGGLAKKPEAMSSGPEAFGDGAGATAAAEPSGETVPKQRDDEGKERG
jgi:flagellar biogenesis protein FliO